MKICNVSVFCTICCLFLFSMPVIPVHAGTDVVLQEAAMSETLDLWRDNRYEQLYERLAHRGKTSKEQFVKKMRDAAIHPACCWQKMENFKVLREKRTEATVYAKIGLEGLTASSNSSTREFKMTHEGGAWKMQLNDIFSLAGVTAKKSRHYSKKKSSPYYH